jgi:hypothetical protein
VVIYVKRPQPQQILTIRGQFFEEKTFEKNVV